MTQFGQVLASTPDEKAGDRTSHICELPSWLSTGMGGASTLGTTADPAAFVWRAATMPRPHGYLNRQTRIVYERVPNLPTKMMNTEDLMPEGITHRDFAAWARSKMGGDISDMLDV